MMHSSSAHPPFDPEVFDDIMKGIDYPADRGWILWAWAALVRAGDVPEQLDEYDVDYTSHLITFVALGSFYERFQDVYSGTTRDEVLMIEVLGDYRPYITDIDIARYCERHGLTSLEDQETGHGLLQEAVTHRREQVRLRLRELFGDARLFTSLVIAGRPAPEPEYDEHGEEIEPETLFDPLAEEAFDSHIAEVTSDLSGAQAYEWLRDGLDY